MNYKLYTLIATLVFLLAFSGCANANQNTDIGDNKTAEYHKITQEAAKAIIDSGDSYILLDVRTQEEYNAEHIVGATLIPVDEIKSRAGDELTDKDALIMVYCRTGVRSKNASEILVGLGYTNIQDIGGISTWPYEKE
ncbi:MAG: rhodanese-like domain-containing protein [Clostridiales bacterium]|nr:rhodanese-like domain-containing protein [Clostridiales bacterium]